MNRAVVPGLVSIAAMVLKIPEPKRAIPMTSSPPSPDLTPVDGEEYIFGFLRACGRSYGYL
jgi:hypothetical protein